MNIAYRALVIPTLLAASWSCRQEAVTRDSTQGDIGDVAVAAEPAANVSGWRRVTAPTSGGIFAASPAGEIVCGGEDGVYVSYNRGVTWKRIRAGIVIESQWPRTYPREHSYPGVDSDLGRNRSGDGFWTSASSVDGGVFAEDGSLHALVHYEHHTAQVSMYPLRDNPRVSRLEGYFTAPYEEESRDFVLPGLATVTFGSTVLVPVIAPNGEPSIIASPDGGASWAVRWKGKAGDGQPWAMCRTGLSSAVLFLEGKRVIVTRDAGQTWSDLQCRGLGSGRVDLNPIAAAFPSLEIGFAVTYDGRIFRTSDGGCTWAQQDVSHEDRLFNWVASNDGVSAWVAGERGLLLETRDGGEHWMQVPVECTGSVGPIVFIGDQVWVKAGKWIYISQLHGK